MLSFYTRALVFGVFTLVSFGVVLVAQANHAWGSYHWARTVNPLTLKLGDNVSSLWDAYLRSASQDWNTPSDPSLADVLDTSVVAGLTNPKTCKAVNGRVEVCNNKYGNNGWLGVAQIWVSGAHITKGVVKMNDTYFNTPRYNTPAWRQLVVCQEIGHTFGLDHQDENFTNLNLNTCMDYTSDPMTNQRPNYHDYEELALIYNHLDSVTSAFSSALSKGKNADVSVDDRSEWGKEMRKDKRGKGSLYERDLGRGNKVFTFVTWAAADNQ